MNQQDLIDLERINLDIQKDGNFAQGKPSLVLFQKAPRILEIALALKVEVYQQRHEIADLQKEIARLYRKMSEIS